MNSFKPIDLLDRVCYTIYSECEAVSYISFRVFIIQSRSAICSQKPRKGFLVFKRALLIYKEN